MPRPNSSAIAGLVRSSERLADGAGDLARRVADGRAPRHLDADRGQLAREVGRVRVDREAEQQLVADRDDLYVHEGLGRRA